MANHSSILAWEIPWTEEPDELRRTEFENVENEKDVELVFYE